MKKLLLIVAVALTTMTSAFSQATDYKPFKVDAGFLYAMPGGNDAVKSGFGVYIEPKYNLTNQIAVGLKWEVAAMGAADQEGMSVSISAINTFQLTGDYYFNQNKVRPFAGLGVGMYTLGSVEVDMGDVASMEDPYELGTKLGFAPRVGLLLGHFRAALEYNIITGVDKDFSDSKNYMSLKLGFEIGGGKK